MSLEDLKPPEGEAAAERAWEIVRAAFAQREPLSHRLPHPPRRGILLGWTALTLLLAVAAAAFSQPGRAVVDHVRRVVGVEKAAPALFSLPTAGRLLVSSDPGVWVVNADGTKRLLPGYREASWSPFGRFIVAARENELAALEPNGSVRWTLARHGAGFPRWTGTETDTRIAYVDRSGIRTIAGDGTGDRLLVRRGTGPVAWQPGDSHMLAYVSGRRLRVIDTDTSRSVLAIDHGIEGRPTAIEWSSDGRRLLVLAPHALRVYDDHGRLVGQEDPSEGWPDVAATFRPGTHEVTVARVHGGQSSVYTLDGRDLFSGTGVFSELSWSPDGRWLLVGWRTADQWVFVSARNQRMIRANANVATQFRSRAFPLVQAWCCDAQARTSGT